MNLNPLTPNPSRRGDEANTNDAIMQRLKSQAWKRRFLTGVALGIGLISIVAGVVLAWANAMMVTPMERLLLQDYPDALMQSGTNFAAPRRQEAKPPLPRAELDWRLVQVTAIHGKEIFLTSASIAVLGVGTFLTLLLVIFNRRVTLRQVNASLAQISNQIKDLQEGKSPGQNR